MSGVPFDGRPFKVRQVIVDLFAVFVVDHGVNCWLAKKSGSHNPVYPSQNLAC